MTQRSLRAVFLLVFAALPAFLSAQDTSGMEEQRMQELLARNAAEEQWFGPRNKVSVGFRFLASGGSVDFNNVGSVAGRTVAPPSEGIKTRVYDNGTVAQDGLRTTGPVEVDANGNQISTPGGRYATYATSDDGTRIQTGDYLSYTPGQTRVWGAAQDSQFTDKPGYVSFSNYSTTSEGAVVTDKPGMSAGVELQFTRELGRLSRRIHWGFMTGITINGINSKSAGSVTATLNRYTDYYAISIPNGVTLEGGYQAPDLEDYKDTSGRTYSNSLETTVPLGQTPDGTLSEDDSIAGGATVDGRWQIKGAYFLVKLGPAFRMTFSERLELSGSAGFAGAYAGTSFNATETFKLDSDPELAVGASQPLVSNTTKFLNGYYADLTLEWNANERTALFGGVTAQQLSSYEQRLGDRTANVDLGTTAGLRGGLSLRF